MHACVHDVSRDIELRNTHALGLLYRVVQRSVSDRVVLRVLHFHIAMLQDHGLLKNYDVEDELISSAESSVFGASDIEQLKADKLRSFLAKLNPVCQSNFMKNWMDLACCGEAALAVYKDVKAALEQQIPLRKLEEALSAAQEAAGDEDVMSSLKCGCCSGLIMDPVCFPCGHSTCKTCIDKLPAPPLASSQQSRLVECPQCKQPWSVYIESSGERRRNPTVLVTSLWDKHLAAQCKAAGLKEQGNTFATEGEYWRAVESYSQSLVAGKCAVRMVLCSWCCMGRSAVQMGYCSSQVVTSNLPPICYHIVLWTSRSVCDAWWRG